MTNFCDLGTFLKLGVLRSLNIGHSSWIIEQYQQQLLSHEFSLWKAEIWSPFQRTKLWYKVMRYSGHSEWAAKSGFAPWKPDSGVPVLDHSTCMLRSRAGWAGISGERAFGTCLSELYNTAFVSYPWVMYRLLIFSLNNSSTFSRPHWPGKQ